MKQIHATPLVMGILLTVVAFVMICFAWDDYQERTAKPEPQGMVITMVGNFLTDEGRLLWFIEYMKDGEMQPRVTVPTEAYALRLVKYLMLTKDVKWEVLE